MKKKNVTEETMRARLAETQRDTIRLMTQTHDAVSDLAQLRAINKLSNSRERGVMRELSELIKVISSDNY